MLKIVPTAPVALFCLALFSGAVQANDSTIPCNAPPDKGARVAVHPGTQVSTVQNKTEGTCTFSVNGAVADSPPPEDVLRALNAFRDRSRPYLSDDRIAVTAVANLLAAAAPVNEVPREILARLDSAKPELKSCLSVFFEKQDISTIRSPDGRFACGGIRPYKSPEEKAALLRNQNPAVGVLTLLISLEWGDGRFLSRAYLPIDMAR